MSKVTLEMITERLELADQLLAGRNTMVEPQDLPGRYGHVIKAVDHILNIVECEAVVAGGWAVWRHGFEGRLSHDVDIVFPTDRIDEFIQAALCRGFTVIPRPQGRWPRVLHQETEVKIIIMPEGAHPGSPANPAPTTIPHPSKMGALAGRLAYVDLSSLVELKLAAGRAIDTSDVVELIRANQPRLPEIREHLARVHEDYALRFDALVGMADEQER